MKLNFKEALKGLDVEGVLASLFVSFCVLVVLGAVSCFLILSEIGTKTWRENYTKSLDNIYVRTETRKDTYKVTVESFFKEKKRGSIYTVSFEPVTDNYFYRLDNCFTRAFPGDEYKAFIGEGCNRLETDTYVLSLIIPSRQWGDIYEVIVLRTAEFGEDKFSDEEIRKIAEVYFREIGEDDSYWSDLNSCETNLLELFGIKCTKEVISSDNKGLFVKAEDYWVSLKEEGYKKLSDN